MKRLTFEETPKTKAGFIEKWNSDHVFKARAKNMGFNVVLGNVIFPNGLVAGPGVH